MGARQPAPPARLKGSSTNRSTGCCPSANERARGAGRRSLPGRCPAQWARPPPRRAAPAAAHPRLEPRSASFSQSLQCSWSFSSADDRRGLAGSRLTAVSLSSAILKGGLGACRAPATKRAAIGRRGAGHAGTGSSRAGAWGRAAPRPELPFPPALGGPGAGLRGPEVSLTPGPPCRENRGGGESRPGPAAARSAPTPRCPSGHPLPVRGGGPSPRRAVPIG